MEIRRFLRLREQILAKVCENGEAVSIKKDPALSCLNFADLAQYQDELSSMVSWCFTIFKMLKEVTAFAVVRLNSVFCTE